MQIPIKVVVKRKTQEDYILRSMVRTSSAQSKLKEPKIQKENDDFTESTQKTHISTSNVADNERTLSISAYYNTKDQLVEIAFENCYNDISNKIIQVLNLCVHYYLSLYRLKVKKSLTSLVLYEISKLLNHSYITDLCLDDNFVPEGNYYILLDQLSHLKNLSLKRCYINDEVCMKIANQLDIGHPASETLQVLDLGSNFITDIGAKFIGNMLRKNRTLLYLNIADNQISDVGASYILENLIQFSLTKEERLARNFEILHYFTTKLEVYKKCENEIISKLREEEEKENICPRRMIVSKRHKDTEFRQTFTSFDKSAVSKQAEIMTKDIVGDFKDIFDQNILRVDEWVYVSGNLRLSYLNLAYNDLGYDTVRKISEVLKYQSNALKSSKCRGLLKVILQGNNTPKFCKELVDIELLLESAISESVMFFNSGKTSSTIKSRKKLAYK